jgi:hypothetical protein
MPDIAIPFTLLDAIAVLALALALVVGIRLGTPFTLAVVPAILLYVMLVGVLPNVSGIILPFLAVIIGFSMAMATQYIPLPRLADRVEAIVGGIGGLAWGLLLALTLWVSFPIDYKAASNAYIYPSKSVPAWIEPNISRSEFAQAGFRLALGNAILRSALLPHLPKR